MVCMKKLMSRHKFAFLSAVVVLLAMGFLLHGTLLGFIRAHWDILHGHRRVMSYGRPAAWAGEYQRLLLDRYGVRLEWVAGCVVPYSMVSYTDAYNYVSEASIKRQFGRDILKECAEDAEKARKKARGVPDGDGR